MPWLDHLLPSNVIMYEDDVADLMEALRESLPYRIMKRKPHTTGKCAVPEEGSLMAVSSHASPCSGSSDSSFEALLRANDFSEPGPYSTSDGKADVVCNFSLIEYTVIPVKGTFVHFDIRDGAASSKAKSV